MSPSKANPKPFTPSSVKGLMILEAAVLAFLGLWLVNEYMNNIIMQIQVNSLIGTHATTYTMIIGLAIGLGGTVTAFTLRKNLREARYKLEHISSPRLRGSVKHALSALPTIDEESTSTPKHSTRQHASTAKTNTVPQNSPPSKEAQQTPTPAAPTSQGPSTPTQTAPPNAPLPDIED